MVSFIWEMWTSNLCHTKISHDMKVGQDVNFEKGKRREKTKSNPHYCVSFPSLYPDIIFPPVVCQLTKKKTFILSEKSLTF